MNAVAVTITFIVAYLLGSIPFGLIIGLVFKGVDIRNYGSGNIGATNVLRILGPGCGAAAMILDTLKGALPAFAGQQFGGPVMGLAGGAGALIGHNLSVWLRFRGGKGVATSLGVLLGIAPAVAGICLAVWIIVLSLSRYVSLASIIAAVCVPLAMLWLHLPYEVLAFGALAAAWVVLRHRENIKRLLRGTENRFGKPRESVQEKEDA